MVIPSTAQNVELAHEFINFMQRPEIALMNTEYVMYSSPNTEVLAMVSEDEWTQNEAYSPSQELLDSLPMERSEIQENLSNSMMIFGHKY